RPKPPCGGEPVINFGIALASSAMLLKALYTCSNSAALLAGEKNSTAFSVLFPNGSDLTCQRFHGYISSPFSPSPSRSSLTTTCGPELIERLLTRARSVALATEDTSANRSGSPLPAGVPGTFSKLVTWYWWRFRGDGMSWTLTICLPISQAST